VLSPPPNPRVLFSDGSLSRNDLARLADPALLASARVIKNTPEVSVVALDLAADDGRTIPLLLKTTPLPPRSRRLAERLAPNTPRLHARLTRQREGAARLQNAGIPTARVRAHTRSARAHRNATETLVLERFDAPNLLEYLRDHPAPSADRRRLAHAVGTLTAQLHIAGLTNRDHKPSNILVAAPEPRDAPPDAVAFRLVLIDTVGIGPSSSPDLPRTLANLYTECLGTNTRIGLTERTRVIRAAQRDMAVADARRRRKRLWRAVDRIVRRHRDPTPKDDPLGDSPTAGGASTPARG
jgi:hypothetical protein